MQRVHVELPGVPEGLTVYVTSYLPQADKKGERGALKLAVEAFGGVAVGNPRYSWMHKAIFNLPNTSAAIKELVTAYPTLKLRKNIAKIGAAPAAEPTLLPKRKPTEAPFFSPEHKMPWHAERKRCERAWAEAQQTVSSLITEVVKKTVPQLEGLNKRLRTKLDNLKAELKSANMSNSAFQKAKGKMQNSKKRRKKPFKSDASVVVKPRDVKEAAADLAAASEPPPLAPPLPAPPLPASVAKKAARKVAKAEAKAARRARVVRLPLQGMPIARLAARMFLHRSGCLPPQ